MGRLLKVLWILCLLAIFFLLLLPYVSPRYRGLLDNIVHPILPKVSDQFYAVKDVQNENLELREKLADLESQQDYWNRLFEENAKLRQLSEMPKRNEYKAILAEVSARSPLTWKSRFVIDRGSDAGFYVGLPVVVNDSLFGRLVDVKKSHSVVRTIAEEDIFVFCRLKGTEIFGKLTGEVSGAEEGELLCQLTWLPRDVDIKAGMLVETSGFSSEKIAIEMGSGLIPGGLKIGKVKSVKRNEKYQTAIVVLSAHWQSFDYVSILKKKEK